MTLAAAVTKLTMVRTRANAILTVTAGGVRWLPVLESRWQTATAARTESELATTGIIYQAGFETMGVGRDGLALARCLVRRM